MQPYPLSWNIPKGSSWITIFLGGCLSPRAARLSSTMHQVQRMVCLCLPSNSRNYLVGINSPFWQKGACPWSPTCWPPMAVPPRSPPISPTSGNMDIHRFANSCVDAIPSTLGQMIQPPPEPQPESTRRDGKRSEQKTVPKNGATLIVDGIESRTKIDANWVKIWVAP